MAAIGSLGNLCWHGGNGYLPTYLYKKMRSNHLLNIAAFLLAASYQYNCCGRVKSSAAATVYVVSDMHLRSC